MSLKKGDIIQLDFPIEFAPVVVNYPIPPVPPAEFGSTGQVETSLSVYSPNEFVLLEDVTDEQITNGGQTLVAPVLTLATEFLRNVKPVPVNG